MYFAPKQFFTTQQNLVRFRSGDCQGIDSVPWLGFTKRHHVNLSRQNVRNFTVSTRSMWRFYASQIRLFGLEWMLMRTPPHFSIKQGFRFYNKFLRAVGAWKFWICHLHSMILHASGTRTFYKNWSKKWIFVSLKVNVKVMDLKSSKMMYLN